MRGRVCCSEAGGHPCDLSASEDVDNDDADDSKRRDKGLHSAAERTKTHARSQKMPQRESKNMYKKVRGFFKGHTHDTWNTWSSFFTIL